MAGKPATEFDYEKCKTSRPILYLWIAILIAASVVINDGIRQLSNDVKAMQPCRTTEVQR